MLYQLTKEQFPRVQPLLSEETQHHVFCAGVLSGRYEGIVLVDDVDTPQTAVICKDGTWCYFGGDPHNQTFQQALQTELADRQFLNPEATSLLLSLPSEEWLPLFGSLLPNRDPIPMPRRLYLATEDHFETSNQLADGFSLHFMDETLSNKADGAIPHDIQNVLTLRTQSDTAAFGFVAVHNRQCVAWAMVDCIVGEHGEIGLYTDGTFRRKGLATAVSSATIQYGLAHGLTHIHWDCAQHNRGSNAIAERLKLQNTLEHNMYLLIFNEGLHRANVAWNHLDGGHFEQVLPICQELIQHEQFLQHAYFVMGAAHLALGNEEEAVQAVQTAVTHGWNDLSEFKTHYQTLQTHPEWDTIISSMNTNQQAQG